MEEQETPKINTFKRLTGVITNPVATFEDIRKRPDYLTPILLMLLTSIIAASVITPIALDKTFTELVEKSPEAADRINAMRPVGYIMGIISAAAMPLVIWLVMTALIHVFAGLAGGEGEFKPLLSVLGYAGIPGYLKAIVMTMVVFFTENPQPKLGLDLLFKPEDNVGKIINVVLSNIEILNLWNIALIIVGISVAKQLSRKQAVIPWAIWWVIITALQVVGTLFQKGAMLG
ncbi:YIP1 family protein [Candidatus Poribacteria bacterium]|nr:YIP1 family protein [Candidatus Poribacteria bacterium]